MGPRALPMLDRSPHCSPSCVVFQTDLFQNSSNSTLIHLIISTFTSSAVAVCSPLGRHCHCRQELHLDAEVHGWKCDEREREVLRGLQAFSCYMSIKDKGRNGNLRVWRASHPSQRGRVSPGHLMSPGGMCAQGHLLFVWILAKHRLI